jgi:hypothetical protein
MMKGKTTLAAMHRPSQNNNKDNVLNKFHAFLAYEMEFGYDLAIAPSLNVSGSFGFESFVGLFG